MIWKKFPHHPEVGSTIYGILKDEKRKRFFEIKIQDNTSISHIEKWCYKEEMTDCMDQVLSGRNCYDLEKISGGTSDGGSHNGGV